MNPTQPGACFHCGEPLPMHAALETVAGQSRAFCCTGCAAAARWIREGGLEDYYRLRERDAARVTLQPQDFSAWDRDDIVAEHSLAVEGGREITLLTDDMRCAACAWLIDRALHGAPGVGEVVANAATGRIRIVWDPARVALSSLLSRLAGLGYRAWLSADETRERERRRERRRWLLRLGVAGLGAMQTMMYAEALYLDTAGEMSVPTRDFFRWVAFLVSTPVVFYAGWPFIAGMWRELRHRRLGMDTLIASSTLLAYVASLYETIRGGTHVWFDAAVMFVFLLLLARIIEQRVRDISNAQVDALARARPTLATRERDDGALEQVPLAALAVGDIVRTTMGDAVPADGVLLPADAQTDTPGDLPFAFDESLLTGESTPVARFAGDTVYAGSLCRDQSARIRVERTGADTRLSELVRLVERAQAQKPALADLADRIAGVFVAALALIAMATYIGWRMHDPARAFEVALAVLVVSCPCALSLAIPTALAAAHGALAKLGVLVLRPDALRTLAKADCFVFDKTGTLSERNHPLAKIDVFADLDAETALGIARALERDSRHPFAAAFAHDNKHASTLPQVSERHEYPGLGLRGVIDAREWRLGRASWATGRQDDDEGLWLGDGAQAYARFVLRESPRADAAATVAELRALRLPILLCSGDAAIAVNRFADALGIQTRLSRQTPEDKLACVRARQAAGEVVAMVGDGINDAPVLAGADVSLALADGAALAQRAADIVIVGGSLRRIPQAWLLARRTRSILRQNIAWAIGYNLLALPLAISGAMTPWMAAIGMALSSLLVTLNAMRLLRGVRADGVQAGTAGANNVDAGDATRLCIVPATPAATPRQP